MCGSFLYCLLHFAGATEIWWKMLEDGISERKTKRPARRRSTRPNRSQTVPTRRIRSPARRRSGSLVRLKSPRVELEGNPSVSIKARYLVIKHVLRISILLLRLARCDADAVFPAADRRRLSFHPAVRVNRSTGCRMGTRLGPG